MKKIQIVICVLIKDGKVLVEKRGLNGYSHPQLLLPGGMVEESEVNDLNSALKREAREELGIELIDFILLTSNEEIRGMEENFVLRPFLINKWKGNIPEKVLDTGDELLWVKIEEALNSPLKPTRKIVEALKKYLSL